MALYNATPLEVEQFVKQSGTGYPSIDRPWLSYYAKEALSSAPPECSLYEYLYESNKRNLDSYALNYSGKKITFRELFKRIDKAARAFQKLGVQEGDIVSVVALTSVPAVVTLYALNRIGAVCDFVNVLSTAKDMVKFFRNNKSRVIVSADIYMNKVLLAAKAIGVEHVITFSLADDMPLFRRISAVVKSSDETDSYLQDSIVLTWDRFLNCGRNTPEITYRKPPDTPALLAHTGGTTGFPKSVLLSDNAMNAVAYQYHSIFHAEPNSVFLDLMVPFVVYGSLINLHMPLTMRCCVALVPQFSPQDWPEYFNKYKPNYITAIPNYIAPMMRNPRMRNVDLKDLKVIAVGGEGVSNALETDFNRFLKEHNAKIRLAKGYGMTEMSSAACTCFGPVNALGTVGVPLPFNNIMVFNNEKGIECKYNEIGEICFQGPGRMLCYKDDPQEMAKILRTHSDGQVWVHTGDLGYMNRRGFLFIVGRIKRVILTQYKGVAYRIYPNIIEETLMSHPAVREACVVALRKDKLGRTKAYVALHDHNRIDEAELERELRSYCQSEMGEFMIPYVFEFRGSLPKTTAGKIDYKLLEQLTIGT